MSAPVLDAPPAQTGSDSSKVSMICDVGGAHRAVRRWVCWFAAPAAVLLATPILGLDRSFVAVGLLFAAVVIIRLVQAWSDYDVAVRDQSGQLTRREKVHRRRQRAAASK